MSINSFDEVECLLKKLVDRSTSSLTKEEISEVVCFIDVGEYGLAIQTYADIIIEEQKTISNIEFELLNDLKNQLQMSKEQLDLNRVGKYLGKI